MNDTIGLRNPEIDDDEVLSMAEVIVVHLLGSRASRVARLGGGLTNFVFSVDHPEGGFIVRMSLTAAKINDYLKEQWAMTKAREVGVPTPEILEVGCEAVAIPYMVSRRVEGREAVHHPERFRILGEMGAFTALIHTVPTSGFGKTFDWSKNQLSRNESWKDYLHDELKVEERIATLEAHRLLSAPQAEALRTTFARIETWTASPALNHGDVRLKNVLADEDGRILALIDWEFCCSNMAPYWDLSLALHDISIDAKEEYLAGYGLREDEIREMAPALKAFNLVNYAPYVAEAAAANDGSRLERYRTRLSGRLDLFSL